MGKYPGKYDLEYFIQRLRQGTHCSHEPETVFLGCEFRTDMFVCEIDLSSKEVNTSPENQWLDTAMLITLSEAAVLAAGRY